MKRHSFNKPLVRHKNRKNKHWLPILKKRQGLEVISVFTVPEAKFFSLPL